MKKPLSLLLAVALVLSLTACGGDTSSGSKDVGSTQGVSSGNDNTSSNSNTAPDESADVKGTVLELETSYEVPDYTEFTLVSITTTDKVTSSMDGSFYYPSDDGKIYVDVVFDLTNTGTEAIDIDDFMSLTAVNSSGTSYPCGLYCIESDGMTDLDTWGEITPLASTRFHAAVAVPDSETKLTLDFDIGGSPFTYEYETGQSIKKTIELHPGDVIENENYASMEFLDYEFTEDLLPPNTSGYYRHYQVDDTNSIYLVLKFNVTNYQATSKDIDTFIGVGTTFADKYKYTGFVVQEDEDGRGFSSYDNIDPLTSAKLYYLIEVPKTVMDKSFAVNIVFDKQEYTFSV